MVGLIKHRCRQEWGSCMTDQLTLDEIRQMFGGTIPEAAMDIIRAANDDTTLDDLRPALKALLVTEYAALRKRRVRVLFGQELNSKRADGQG